MAAAPLKISPAPISVSALPHRTDCLLNPPVPSLHHPYSTPVFRLPDFLEKFQQMSLGGPVHRKGIFTSKGQSQHTTVVEPVSQQQHASQKGENDQFPSLKDASNLWMGQIVFDIFCCGPTRDIQVCQNCVKVEEQTFCIRASDLEMSNDSSASCATRNNMRTMAYSKKGPWRCSGKTTLLRVRFPAGSPLDFRKWELCRTMPLDGGFSRGSPVSPRPCIPVLLHTSLHPHWLSRPRC
ncbi:hypothetical protein PR048_003002 [Dryococelus australis]|uniref:Uncharacterized protein n=1 Tax=Dryococelus australis TaxID=614101 RepID=A0ABQ9IP18_9NEOP|nr:hypothetical protein PR048_003002 [Dryococelus australis]